MPSTAPTKEEESWKAENDARTLAEASVISADKERVRKASSAAKRIIDQMKEQADEQEEMVAALRMIALGGNRLSYSSMEEQ